MPAATTKTLYALMVAIDAYPIERHRLNGCVNDRDALKDYIEQRIGAQKNIKLDIKTLTDKEATKANIIAGFSHFSKAKDGDICLLYFSGHGSQAPAPPEFWHLDPDRMNESVVCWDSRIPNGKDLMDKELSYLIWKATFGKKVHFAAIFDCCHAGSNTRNADANVTPRMAEPSPVPATLEDYHGYKAYKRATAGKVVEVSPPRGNHIHLAAAKANETAKELRIDNKTRGVFTYTLIETLELNGGQISYADLMHIIGVKVGNRVVSQTPQLDSVEAQDKNNFFLGGAVEKASSEYLLTYRSGKWTVDVGAIHGIPESGGLLTLKDGGETVRITKVLPNYSEVDGLAAKDTNKSYKAVVKDLEVRKLKVAFAKGVDRAGDTAIRKALKTEKFPLVELVTDEKDAAYLIRTGGKAFQLTLPGEIRPVFRRVPELKDAKAHIFLDDVQTIARRNNLLVLSNPRTTIRDEEFEIELYRITDIGNDADNAEKELTDWKKPVVYRYEQAGGEWKQPYFQLKIKNKGLRTFYVSGLYIGDTGGVNNKFLSKAELAPGTEAWFLDTTSDGTQYKSIPLEVDEKYHAWGVTEIRENIKLFISTDPALNTDRYNQDGLELDVPPNFSPRGAGRNEKTHPAVPDWTTKDIVVTIVRPMEQALLASGRSVSLLDAVTVEAPEGMSANISLTSAPEATRGLNEADAAKYDKSPERLWGAQKETQAYAFTQGNNLSPAPSVLELRNVTGKEGISADTPLKVNLGHALGQDEFVAPLAFDETSGLYYFVGMSDSSGVVSIETLPDETASGTRSLGGSIKIFFYKVVLSKLGFEYKHPQLSMAAFKSTDVEDYDYVTDVAKIKAAVGKASNIVLFMHGIIGDTLDMAKCMRRAKVQTTNELIDRKFDLALTFDYENLKTEINETAVEFKKRLEAVGLKAGHGKKLTIIAHSMGGLVSRWFIEKEGGNQVVTHLIQVGTPNSGSAWSDLYEMTSMLMSRAVNGAVFLKPYILPLSLLGKLAGNLFITLQQMDPDGSFLKQLNDGADPGIRYTIVAGNTQLIPTKNEQDQKNLMKRMIARFKSRGHYDALDALLFKEANDIAVATTSIYGIPGKENRTYPPVEITVGCDHISYFCDPEGLKGIGKAVGG